MRRAMLLLAVLGLAGLLYSADNPFIGIWKFNAAKSKATDPSLLPKSETIKTVAQGESFTTTFDGVDDKGKTYHAEHTSKWDGKDYALKGDPSADAVAITRVDANTLSVATKKAGKVLITYPVIISKDGKTMTVPGKLKDDKGTEQSFNAIYEKQ